MHGTTYRAECPHPETGQFSLTVLHQPTGRPSGQKGLPSEEDTLVARSHPRICEEAHCLCWCLIQSFGCKLHGAIDT